MINRRLFMSGSLAAGAAAVLPVARAIPHGWLAPLVVVGGGDPRAQAFGAVMRWCGCSVLTAGADALPLIERLEALLAQAPRPIRGLTSFSIRMIVEHATSTLGMRLSFASPYPKESGTLSRAASSDPGHDPALAHAFAGAARREARMELYTWALVPSGAAGASVRRLANEGGA